MPKQKKKIKIIIVCIVMLGGACLLGWWGITTIDKSFQGIYDAGYIKGYNSGINTKIADYKYWCEDKSGWMPQNACDNEDVCRWLSKEENRIYGCFYSSCFDWFQEEMRRKAEIYEGALGE